MRALILSSSGGIDMSLYPGYSRSLYGHLTEAEADSLRYWNGRIDRGDTGRYARGQRARWLAFAYVFHKEYAPIIAARLAQTDRLVNSLVWQDLRRTHFDCAPGLARFRKPALILQGRQDIVDSSAAQKAHRVLQGSRLVWLDECRHYGWLDQRARFLQEVYAFLKAVS
ncbi:MAG: alpha/beta hydrolase [Chitinophagaceae bacterium]|nr:MAG: alpha/beta hydrolase [Chitinophagaceae bacterium]